MPPWIHHPHTSYVIAAYGVAAVALPGLILASWRSLYKRQIEWKKLRAKGLADDRY